MPDLVETNEIPSDYIYQVTLTGPGQILEVYVGDSWMGFDQSIAFMDPDSFTLISHLLEMSLKRSRLPAGHKQIADHIAENFAKPRVVSKDNEDQEVQTKT